MDTKAIERLSGNRQNGQRCYSLPATLGHHDMKDVSISKIGKLLRNIGQTSSLEIVFPGAEAHRQAEDFDRIRASEEERRKVAIKAMTPEQREALARRILAKHGISTDDFTRHELYEYVERLLAASNEVRIH